MPTKTHEYTLSELDTMAQNYLKEKEDSLHTFRGKITHSKKEIETTKTDRWDPPLVVCACASKRAPYYAACSRNNSALKQPNPVLWKAYANIKDSRGEKVGSIPIGTQPDALLRDKLGLKGEYAGVAGRCAEPHAAQRVLNQNPKVKDVSDLLFGPAYDARYPIAKPYCVTCKCVFSQLR